MKTAVVGVVTLKEDHIHRKANTLRANLRRLATIVGGSAIALVISAAPIASATTRIISPAPQQGCSTSGFGTVCRTPGNAQLNDFRAAGAVLSVRVRWLPVQPRRALLRWRVPRPRRRLRRRRRRTRRFRRWTRRFRRRWTPLELDELVSLRVAIVGGGIGGLSTAVALRAIGAQVEVFEQARQIGDVGAGVGLQQNSQGVLRRLGLDREIRRIAAPVPGMRIYDPDGVTLSSTAFAADAAQLGVHRADLVAVLAAALPTKAIHIGRRCTQFSQQDGSATVRFDSGEEVEADVVIAADGIHSGTTALCRRRHRARVLRHSRVSGARPGHPPDRLAAISCGVGRSRQALARTFPCGPVS